MRLGYDANDFPDCIITSSFESLLECPGAQNELSLELYQAMFAARNEAVTLVPFETIGNLTATVTGAPNSSTTFYDKLFNGYIDALLLSLFMTEERVNYFSFSNPFDSPDRICFYIHPNAIEQQMLVKSDFWLKPYPGYAWVFVVVAVLCTFVIAVSHQSRWRDLINDLTLGFICVYYRLQLINCPLK